jgi:hypothetical protein
MRKVVKIVIDTDEELEKSELSDAVSTALHVELAFHLKRDNFDILSVSEEEIDE